MKAHTFLFAFWMIGTVTLALIGDITFFERFALIALGMIWVNQIDPFNRP